MKLHVDMCRDDLGLFQTVSEDENFFFFILPILLFPPSSYLNMTDGVVLSDNLLVCWW